VKRKMERNANELLIMQSFKVIKKRKHIKEKEQQLRENNVLVTEDDRQTSA